MKSSDHPLKKPQLDLLRLTLSYKVTWINKAPFRNKNKAFLLEVANVLTRGKVSYRALF